jgi:hypothetical protein
MQRRKPCHALLAEQHMKCTCTHSLPQAVGDSNQVAAMPHNALYAELRFPPYHAHAGAAHCVTSDTLKNN